LRSEQHPVPESRLSSVYPQKVQETHAYADLLYTDIWAQRLISKSLFRVAFRLARSRFCAKQRAAAIM